MSSLVRLVGVALWALWNLPAICRASRDEENDIRLHAADAGMTPDEWIRANREAGL